VSRFRSGRSPPWLRLHQCHLWDLRDLRDLPDLPDLRSLQRDLLDLLGPRGLMVLRGRWCPDLTGQPVPAAP
jgi:hypothetical protein